MNAQQLAALGTMVRDAITEHCKALGEVFAQQLSERDQQIELLTAQLQQLQNSQTLGYDDTEIKQAVQALREAIPAAYDGAEVKQMVAEGEARIVAKHALDVEHLLGRISDVAKSIPAAYDDTAVRDQINDLTARTNAHAEIVKGYAENLPNPYNDTALRQEIAESLKFQTESFEAVIEQFKQLPKPADGRDALQLEVLPAIDEAKSYTRGTYAKHAGGLWRAFEQTSGMRGWECIVNGVKSVDARWDGKTLIETTTLSDGTTHETRKSFAVQEYKGVFAHGEHEQGDTVTWAGSLWHCNVTGTKALPGDGSADWTLAVKKGRDGREVVKTERAQGPVKIDTRRLPEPPPMDDEKWGNYS